MKLSVQSKLVEAGCDEAGRGCIAGPVVAAAVILPKSFEPEFLNDSKQLSAKKRAYLRTKIEQEAIDFAIAFVSSEKIDEINILNASFLAMHKALDQLVESFEFIAVDGNRFTPYKDIPHQCCVKGDANYLNIAAASILAKTYRDEYMEKIHEEFPYYHWKSNKGYPTKAHRKGIIENGSCKYHRKSFTLIPPQLSINFPLSALEQPLEPK